MSGHSTTSQPPTPSILMYEPFRMLDTLDQVISLEGIYPGNHFKLLRIFDDVVPSQVYGTTLNKAIPCEAKPPGIFLKKFPAEVRLQIFRDVSRTKWRRSLLVALRPSHKDSTLYEEALQAYYDVNLCIISKSNEPYNRDISSETQQLVRFLQIDFDTVKNISTTGRIVGRFIYTVDTATGRMLSHEFTSTPIIHSRILPKPTFNTMAGFTNIKFLHLNAYNVCESRIHQIEGMVKQAVKTCDKLERVEVTSDYASAQHVDGRISDGNDKWIARLNNGMKIRGKLTEVNARGTKWHWFWQAPNSEKLTWKERRENAVKR